MYSKASFTWALATCLTAWELLLHHIGVTRQHYTRTFVSEENAVIYRNKIIIVRESYELEPMSG